jgi:hypothetical protein
MASKYLRTVECQKGWVIVLTGLDRRSTLHQPEPVSLPPPQACIEEKVGRPLLVLPNQALAALYAYVPTVTLH